MPNIIDYVKNTGQRSFDEQELNVLDIAVLNELAYLPLEELLVQLDISDLDSDTNFHTVSDLLQAYHRGKSKIVLTFMVTQERLNLLEEVLASPRYEDLHFGNYVNDISQEFEKQFAAIVLSFPSISHTQVIFRGTDNSLIGWKEDLNMTYMSEIPAQRSAKVYLAEFLEQIEQSVVISGHSKGGNLALYAASYVLGRYQEKIEQIYLFDSPGLHQRHLDSFGYQAIKPKIKFYQPYEAIVGVMLAADVMPKVVASSEKGFAQHLMTSWEVGKEDFIQVPQASDFSVALGQTFDDWMTSYSKQELKIMVDSFFSIFLDAGLVNLDDFQGLNQVSLSRLITQFSSIDPVKRNLMLKSLTKMVDLFRRHDQALKRAHAAAKFQSWYQNSFLDRVLDGLLKKKMVDQAKDPSQLVLDAQEE